MPTDNFGLSFAPTAQNQQQNAQNGQQTPIADAIKVLNLRIPQFSGASPIPGQLLNAQGGMGIPTASGVMPGGLEQYLRMLFGQMGQMGQMGMQQPGMPGGRPGAPSVLPGGPSMPTPPPKVVPGAPSEGVKDVRETPTPSAPAPYTPTPLQQDYK